MKDIPIANLEAELGCLDLPPLNAAVRNDHGKLPDLFDPPAASTFEREPPSKAKALYSFGNDGTLAWTTAAGELLQVARFINNRIVGANYKKSIKRGPTLQDRCKMLEEAAIQPQGSGVGIGLSLYLPGDRFRVEPYRTCWVQNRWPRFYFEYKGLDIRLQYYIESHYLIQEYQVRNLGEEEVSLPYMFSSDVCFREHGPEPNPIDPITSGKSSARSLLCQNSEVLIRSQAQQCELAMALFLNSQRHSLWVRDRAGERSEGGSDSEALMCPDEEMKGLREIEKRLRVKIREGNLVDYAAPLDLDALYEENNRSSYGITEAGSQDNFSWATSQNILTVPGRSTQELRAVLRISTFSHRLREIPGPCIAVTPAQEEEATFDNMRSDVDTWFGLSEPQALPTERKVEFVSIGSLSSSRYEHDSEQRSIFRRALDKREQLDRLVREFSSELPEDQRERHTTKLIYEHLAVGQAFMIADWIGYAGYYLLMACLIAEHAYKEGSYLRSHSRFQYAKFLNKSGWYSSALTTMRHLSLVLRDIIPKGQEMATLYHKVQSRLASMYLKRELFREAEMIYHEALPHSISDVQGLKPVWACYLEKKAWAQVRQEKHGEARESYRILLDLSFGPRRTLLCNLGFIETRLNNLEHAKSCFDDAVLQPIEKPEDELEHLYTWSGLFACLRRFGTKPEDVDKAYPPLNRDFNTSFIFSGFNASGLLGVDSHFHFATMRLLESLLSTCSVPVSDDDGNFGFAFVNASAEQCYSESKSSYFKFRFLTQCQTLIHAPHIGGISIAHTGLSARLKATCQGHLIWAFKIVMVRSNDTWQNIYAHYAAEGNNRDLKKRKEEHANSRVVEGAFHFSKLWLYLSAWPQDWEFVLDLLRFRLNDWLRYLQKTRHMENLWVERQSYQTLKPYNTISPDSGAIKKQYPRYCLSDFTMLWLAFRQLESLINLITEGYKGMTEKPVRDRYKDVRDVQEKLASYLDGYSTQELRSNILETFTVSERESVKPRHLDIQHTNLAIRKPEVGQPRCDVPIEPSYQKVTSNIKRPTEIKVHQSYVSPGSLKVYNLPWEWDNGDPNYIVIKRWINENDLDTLFQHTRTLREKRLHTTAAIESMWTGKHESALEQVETGPLGHSILAFERTINENILEISADDIATIEVATMGFFKDEKGQNVAAWEETLRTHKIRYSRNFHRPAEISLILFASKFNWPLATHMEHAMGDYLHAKLVRAFCDTGDVVDSLGDEKSDPIRSWAVEGFETLSIVLASLFPECRLVLPLEEGQHMDQSLQRFGSPQPTSRPERSLRRRISIVMPQKVGTSQRFSKARILDAEFLPKWIYHFPDYIRHQALHLKIKKEIVHINNISGALNRAAIKWNKSNGFDDDSNNFERRFRFWPHVADAGPKYTFQSYRTGRYVAVDLFVSATRLYNRLLKPRTFEQGKKRLVELPSHNLDTALICWLTVPPEEKPFFEDFVNRHSLSECFFGERVDWRGNIWESEFHLGFFQMLPNEDEDGFLLHMDDSPDLRRTQEIPSLQGTSGNRKLGLVAASLRFVGDLRDRLWTCHFYSSISREGGYTGVLNRFWYSEGENKEELYSDTIGQRRILELSYIRGILKEMEESSEGIIEVIQDELGVSEAQDVQNQSYESIRDYSQVHLTTGEILRNVLGQFNTALGVIGDWEGREESRGIQSRWSDKDEKRYGEKLKDLTRKCKVSVQHLRTQKTRFEEQQLRAEQRHNNLLTYLQLQDARKSSQSAEDVRLFTYVTIVFLPLSFTASLFSMQGAPSGNTISIMVQTTVVALAITVLVLANMKTLDRNWSYRVSTFGARTRKRMLEAGNEFWVGRAEELKTAAELRASKPESLKHLPAESKWYYFRFWIWYTLGRPTYRVIDGLGAWRNRKNLQLRSVFPGTSNESEPRTSDDNHEGLDLVRDGKFLSDDDEMELAIEENASAFSETGAKSESQRTRVMQQGPKDDADEVKQHGWIRLFKNKKRSESKV